MAITFFVCSLGSCDPNQPASMCRYRPKNTTHSPSEQRERMKFDAIWWRIQFGWQELTQFSTPNLWSNKVRLDFMQQPTIWKSHFVREREQKRPKKAEKENKMRSSKQAQKLFYCSSHHIPQFATLAWHIGVYGEGKDALTAELRMRERERRKWSRKMCRS